MVCAERYAFQFCCVGLTFRLKLNLWDLRFLYDRVWKLLSSGLWHVHDESSRFLWNCCYLSTRLHSVSSEIKQPSVQSWYIFSVMILIQKNWISLLFRFSYQDFTCICPAHLILLDLLNLIIFSGKCKFWYSRWLNVVWNVNFLQNVHNPFL